jgi:hypothetical protein
MEPPKHKGFAHVHVGTSFSETKSIDTFPSRHHQTASQLSVIPLQANQSKHANIILDLIFTQAQNKTISAYPRGAFHPAAAAVVSMVISPAFLYLVVSTIASQLRVQAARPIPVNAVRGKLSSVLSRVHHGNSTFSRTISHTFYLFLQNFLTSRVGGGGLFPQLSSKFVR